MLSISLNGLADATRAMADLRGMALGTLQVAVVRAGMQAVAHAMKAHIAPEAADARRDVGYRFERRQSPHMLAGKIGVGVGKPARKRKRQRSASGGIGIDGSTFHWWVLGSFRTGQRQATTYRGRSTAPASRGRMVPQQPMFARQVQLASQAAARGAMQAAASRVISSFARSHR
jgi:hypothetical protein